MKLLPLIGILSINIFITLLPARAQIFDLDTVHYDTTYIRAYRDELTTRLYVSRKQNGYNLSQALIQPWMKYRSNDNLVLGLGYTYSFLTVNLGVKMPFINRDEQLYGKSRYLDLQTHSIFRRFILDLYLQWAKGYYLSNPQSLKYSGLPEGSYPIRGDMRTTIVGLNVKYLFNSERYSFKAGFVQNQFQKRSAGSPILGVEGYWVLGMTDSSMVPELVPPSGFLDNQPFNQVDIANVGINGGYAYTFVWREKLYLSLSGVVGISGGYNQTHDSNSSTTYTSGLTVGFTTSTWISLGYNSNKYSVGMSFIQLSMNNLVGSYGDWFTFNTGNIRLNFVRRFKLNKPIKILRPDLWIF
jgi:hypothetical protein